MCGIVVVVDIVVALIDFVVLNSHIVLLCVCVCVRSCCCRVYVFGVAEAGSIYSCLIHSTGEGLSWRQFVPILWFWVTSEL